MTESGYVSGGRLLEILALSERSDRAAVAAREVLEAHRECSFRVGTVSTADIIRIYGIRLSRRDPLPTPVLGSERMLADLEVHEQDSLAAIVVQHQGTILGIWLTPNREQLVTLTVGRDRRWPEDGSESPPHNGEGRR